MGQNKCSNQSSAALPVGTHKPTLTTTITKPGYTKQGAEWVYWRVYTPHSTYSHKKSQQNLCTHASHVAFFLIWTAVIHSHWETKKRKGWYHLSAHISHGEIWVLMWSSKSIMISRGNDCSHNSNHAVLRQWLCDPELREYFQQSMFCGTTIWISFGVIGKELKKFKLHWHASRIHLFLTQSPTRMSRCSP